MTREELESTAPIHRDKLLGLLDAMTTADLAAPTCALRAAVLPPSQPVRFPRATRPPALVSAKTDKPAVWAVSLKDESVPTLSPAVVAQLTTEEIALLPIEMRLTLPDQVVEIHSTPCNELGHSIHVTGRPRSRDRLPFEIVASIAAMLIVGLWALCLLI